MNGPREHYREYLQRLRDEVRAEGLEDFFPDAWFQSVERHIDAWDGKSIFTLDRETFFISYLQSLDEGQSLVREVKEVAEALRKASPKAAIVRNRIRSLSGDRANAVGGLFELRAILPLRVHTKIDLGLS